MANSSSSKVLYEKVLSENEAKGKQLRLVLNEFIETEYFHLRNYYIDYDGNWMPSKEGASMPATIASVYALLDGLIEICAMQESVDAINRHFADKIQQLKETMPGP